MNRWGNNNPDSNNNANLDHPQSYGIFFIFPFGSSSISLLYAKEQALHHSFDAANLKLIQVHGAELFSKHAEI